MYQKIKNHFLKRDKIYQGVLDIDISLNIELRRVMMKMHIPCCHVYITFYLHYAEKTFIHF